MLFLFLFLKLPMKSIPESINKIIAITLGKKSGPNPESPIKAILN